MREWILDSCYIDDNIFATLDPQGADDLPPRSLKKYLNSIHKSIFQD